MCVCDACGCLSKCERKKGGKSVSQSELWLLESCNWICVFGFPLFLLFPSTTFLQNHPSFHPLINNSPHTPHEGAGNAVDDNTLAIFLFTTPHHHFTRPSLPSHSPRHSSSLLSHCVQPLLTVVTNDAMQTPLVLNLHTFNFLIHSLLWFSQCASGNCIINPNKTWVLLQEDTRRHFKRATRTTWVQFLHILLKYSKHE